MHGDDGEGYAGEEEEEEEVAWLETVAGEEVREEGCGEAAEGEAGVAYCGPG